MTLGKLFIVYCSLGRHPSRVGVANLSIATFTQKLCSASFYIWHCHHLLWNTECPIEIEFPSAAWGVLHVLLFGTIQLFGRNFHEENKEEAADSLQMSGCWPKGYVVTPHSCTTACTGGKNLIFIAVTPTYCIVWKRNASLPNATEGCPLLPGKTSSLGLFASSQDLAHIERVSLLAMIIVLKT